MHLYQFMIAIRNGDQTLSNELGESTAHLTGMFYRTIRMLEAGIKPVFVFEGKPPDMKGGELQKRREKRKEAEADLVKAKEEGHAENIEKFSKRTVRVTPQHNDECKKLLRLLGVPVIEAPGEAEAQCAELVKQGICYSAATEDMDCLTFGVTKLSRYVRWWKKKKK